MAVTKAYPRLKIEILVSDIPLEEFNDEDEQVSPNTTTKFIESQSGVEFEIRSSLSKPWPVCSLLLQVYVDGKYVRSWFMMQRDFEGDTLNIAIQGQSYSKDDKWFLQKFCFSELKIGQSSVLYTSGLTDTICRRFRCPRGFGSTHERPEGPWRNHCEGLPSEEPKTEASTRRSQRQRVWNCRRRSRKGIEGSGAFSSIKVSPSTKLKQHSLIIHSFRPPLATTASRIWEHDYMDDDRDPMATFSFKYRSRGLLHIHPLVNLQC